MRKRTVPCTILLFCSLFLAWIAWQLPQMLLTMPADTHLIAIRMPNQEIQKEYGPQERTEFTPDTESAVIHCLTAARIRRSAETYRQFRYELQLIIEDGVGNPKWITLGETYNFVQQGNDYYEIMDASILRQRLTQILFAND